MEIQEGGLLSVKHVHTPDTVTCDVSLCAPITPPRQVHLGQKGHLC